MGGTDLESKDGRIGLCSYPGSLELKTLFRLTWTLYLQLVGVGVVNFQHLEACSQVVSRNPQGNFATLFLKPHAGGPHFDALCDQGSEMELSIPAGERHREKEIGRSRTVFGIKLKADIAGFPRFDFLESGLRVKTAREGVLQFAQQADRFVAFVLD